jgi:hypothetical protein
VPAFTVNFTLAVKEITKNRTKPFQKFGFDDKSLDSRESKHSDESITKQCLLSLRAEPTNGAI